MDRPRKYNEFLTQDTRERAVQALRPLLPLAVLGLFLIGGNGLRSWLGVELTVESLRELVTGFGWAGPLVFVLGFGLRQTLALPAWFLLPLGGILFGALWGTVLGALGVTINAWVQYAIGRSGSSAKSLAKLREQALLLAEGGGLWALGAVTAHPMGPVLLFHVGAGFSRVALLVFTAVVFPASLVRAGVLATFGVKLVEPWTPMVYALFALMVVVLALPLAHRGVRERLVRTVMQLAEDGSHEPDSRRSGTDS